MNCYLCGNEQLTPVFTYTEPDKYLNAIGLKENKRTWWHCPKCDLYTNTNRLSEEQIQQAYLNYRNIEMRGTTVEEEFNRIIDIPAGESECEQRIEWLDKNLHIKGPMLDIGSGLGIFPYLMQYHAKTVYCIEPEPESARFINEDLKIECRNQFYKPGLFPKANLVTLVHVLEHMKNPRQFLGKVKSDMLPDGKLFIEVPDALEFTYLGLDHDEFNSLHLFFYTMSSLIRMVKSAGFIPMIVERVRYGERNLSRLLMLCD